MRTRREEKRIIRKLKKFCLGKLRENKKKAHWENSNVHYLVSRLVEEVEELTRAIIDCEDYDDVWKEAADVANFAAMIADRYERKL